MKANNIYQRASILLIIIVAIFTLNSCAGLRGVRVENDGVLSEKRAKAYFTYFNAKERLSPMVRVDQTVIKQIGRDAESKCKVFDIITLKSNSFRVSNEVFVIVDGKPVKLTVESNEIQNVSRFSEERSSVQTSDSTSLSVVTGYNENHQRVNRLAYTIDKNTAELIKDSNKVLFRYYAGPDMITVQLSGLNLRRFKRLLNS